MLDFHAPTLDDEQWIKEKISQMDFPTCEYSFGSIFSYTAKMYIRVALIHDCLVTKCQFIEDYIEYCFPAGNGDKIRALDFIIEDGIRNGIPFGIFGMNEDDAKLLGKHFSDKFSIFLERDAFDYIYFSDDLINLKGKKYQSKRNHISYFMKNNNWSYETISRSNIAECIEMSRQWLSESNNDMKDELEAEFAIIRKAFDHYERLGYVGGLLRKDGKVIAYTMGEKISDDVFCVHFEKAFSDIRGAYQMINQQFVKNELSGYKYINREDDTGAENLRKAKLSYYPALLPDKYEAKYKYAD